LPKDYLSVFVPFYSVVSILLLKTFSVSLLESVRLLVMIFGGKNDVD